MFPVTEVIIIDGVYKTGYLPDDVSDLIKQASSPKREFDQVSWSAKIYMFNIYLLSTVLKRRK